MTLFQALILSIIEGITEFLPVSSTGHMIIGTALLGMTPTAFVKLFTVCIQFGAILSVVVLYYRRFLKSGNFYLKLFVAFIPAGVFGLLLDKLIDRMLGSVEVVAISLLVGGIILLFVDNIFKDTEESEEKEITFLMALKIGFFQVISMIPGVSRSGATIVGGMAQKLSRKQAAEFSFFLAVPTMFAATAYKMFKAYKEMNGDAKITTLIKPNTIINTIHHVNHHYIFMLLLGNVVSFIVAMVAIKSFITFLTRHGFKLFGWYRIIAGALILILLFMHVNLSVL